MGLGPGLRLQPDLETKLCAPVGAKAVERAFAREHCCEVVAARDLLVDHLLAALTLAPSP